MDKNRCTKVSRVGGVLFVEGNPPRSWRRMLLQIEAMQEPRVQSDWPSCPTSLPDPFKLISSKPSSLHLNTIEQSESDFRIG